MAKSTPWDNVTLDELGRIFRCEKTDGPAGLKLTIANREKGSPERNLFLKKVYHMNHAAYGRFFLQAVFTGALSAPPRIIPTAAGMKQAAAASPGTVTYILASQIDGTVKALKIDGLAPGDANYPLHIAP